MMSELKIWSEERFKSSYLSFFSRSVTSKYVQNGIACPKCGKELFDEVGVMMLASTPPQVAVVCLQQSCKFKSSRYQ